jgi:hypothetical protein
MAMLTAETQEGLSGKPCARKAGTHGLGRGAWKHASGDTGRCATLLLYRLAESCPVWRCEVAQLAARLSHDQEVGSSSLLPATLALSSNGQDAGLSSR